MLDDSNREGLGTEVDFSRPAERVTRSLCVFCESWASISRDLGHAFQAILGIDFADAGRLADGFWVRLDCFGQVVS